VSKTELEIGTSRTICKKFRFLSREVMGMDFFFCVTCAAKNKSIDPIFYKHKAYATGYVGAERESRLLFGASPVPFSIWLQWAITNANHVTGLSLQANAERTF
jgi:hypothetical protein